MDNFDNQTQKFVLELNQEILDIIYRHTPYPEITKCFKIKILIIFIISFFLSALTFYFSNSSQDNSFAFSLWMFIILSVPFSVIAVFQAANHEEEIDKQIFDFQQLNKAVEEIKEQGLYSQFIQDSLFNPITNPSEPITYIVLEKIGKKQNARARKIRVSEIETKNKDIVNQQKSCVNKYCDKSN